MPSKAGKQNLPRFIAHNRWNPEVSHRTDHKAAVNLPLHMRLNFLYRIGSQISRQLHQPEQVLHPPHGPPLRQLNKRVHLAYIRPTSWKIGHLSFGDVVKHPPLSPALAAVHELKPPAPPRVKRMRDAEKLFAIVLIGCSSHPMPTVQRKEEYRQ